MKEQIKNIIERYNNIDESVINDLENVLQEYPYFQTARMLYLKGLKNEKNYKYNLELKKTAAYVSDRTLLFDFITYDEDLKKGPKTTQKTVTVLEKHQHIETNAHHSPFEFHKNEYHSFSTWLELATPYATIKQQEKKRNNKFDILDKFIKGNVKLKPKREDGQNYDELIKKSIEEDHTLMTETLAQVYIAQKKYAKAIKAYQILSLKYPERKSFFTEKINYIKRTEK